MQPSCESFWFEQFLTNEFRLRRSRVVFSDSHQLFKKRLLQRVLVLVSVRAQTLLPDFRFFFSFDLSIIELYGYTSDKIIRTIRFRDISIFFFSFSHTGQSYPPPPRSKSDHSASALRLLSEMIFFFIVILKNSITLACLSVWNEWIWNAQRVNVLFKRARNTTTGCNTILSRITIEYFLQIVEFVNFQISF